MRVAVVQTAPGFGEIAANVERASELIRGTPADLYVLPEFATTGYQFRGRAEAAALSEPVPDGPSTRAFIALAAETESLVCFGVAERDGDRLMNSAALVGPNGLVLLYRKSHLFMYEFDLFEPGDLGFPVADLPGHDARAGILVCFDWVYPEAARCLALAGADLVLHPSNLVTAWGPAAVVTRSIENGVYTLLSNRVGAEERIAGRRLAFTGLSRIISPRGEVLAALGGGEEGVAVAEVDPARARDKHLTPRNDLLGGRRPEIYGLISEPPPT